MRWDDRLSMISCFQLHFGGSVYLVFFYRIYGFYDECKRRYNIKLWKTFTDCFNCLPIGQSFHCTLDFNIAVQLKLVFFY